MRTVGQIFKEERAKKGFTLTQIEKATKIRAKFLEALEADDYVKLPAVPYTQGFIKNYSDFLGLRSTTMLALFRRQFSGREKQKKELVEEPLTQSGWKLTPNKVIIAVVVILVGILFTYFYGQYRALHAPPKLALESPKEDLITKEDTIPVFGTADPDATLTVNGTLQLLKEDGKFYKDESVTQGNNTITVIATSRAGEKTQIVRHVTRAP